MGLLDSLAKRCAQAEVPILQAEKELLQKVLSEACVELAISEYEINHDDDMITVSIKFVKIEEPEHAAP